LLDSPLMNWSKFFAVRSLAEHEKAEDGESDRICWLPGRQDDELCNH